MDSQQLLHTPEGVRDIYNSECEKKLRVQKKIHKLMHKFGYKDIQTPTFEFFEIFNKERGTISSRDMYKFFDRDGNTLVLRPDFTPSVARCAAKYYRDETLPIRLCYEGNTYVNNSSYQGKLKEETQLGAELIQDDSVEADAEMIALTISCLLEVGLEDFQIEIGHADFYAGLVEEAGLSEEESLQLRALIEEKNIFGVENMIQQKNVVGGLKELFMKLPELFGEPSTLTYAKERFHNEKSKNAFARLEQLQQLLEAYQLSDYITYDLGMLGKLGYYTGIIFRAYTYGTGDALISGGRYDHLMKQFGKSAPAIGLAANLDYLMLALTRQKVKIATEDTGILLIYPSVYGHTAIKIATHYRMKEDTRVTAIATEQKFQYETYAEYGQKHGNGKLIYLLDEKTALVYELNAGTSHRVEIADLL